MPEDPAIKNILPVPSLIGLVVCGGQSKRMGSDKSVLQYYKKPQRYHLYDVLSTLCEKTYLSCNASQIPEIDEGFETLVDMGPCEGIGPMAALVTAITHHPTNDFLVVGCDYPFLKETELFSFIFSNQEGSPAAFYNDIDQVYEPMLAYYHHSGHHTLMKMYATGKYSLQQFLQSQNAAKFHPSDKTCIKSIDTRHDYLKAKKLIDLNPKWESNE
jgi:molybdenum cofactor guanylyltransferase